MFANRNLKNVACISYLSVILYVQQVSEVCCTYSITPIIRKDQTVVHTNDTVIVQGDVEYNISCKTNGTSKDMNVTWTFNRDEINVTSDQQTVNFMNDTSMYVYERALAFFPTQVANRTITCVVEMNNTQVASKSVRLDMYVKSLLIKDDNTDKVIETIVSRGEKGFNISCYATGLVGRLNVSWSFNTTLFNIIQEGEQTSITENGTTQFKRSLYLSPNSSGIFVNLECKTKKGTLTVASKNVSLGMHFTSVTIKDHGTGTRLHVVNVHSGMGYNICCDANETFKATDVTWKFETESTLNFTHYDNVNVLTNDNKTSRCTKLLYVVPSPEVDQLNVTCEARIDNIALATTNVSFRIYGPAVIQLLDDKSKAVSEDNFQTFAGRTYVIRCISDQEHCSRNLKWSRVSGSLSNTTKVGNICTNKLYIQTNTSFDGHNITCFMNLSDYGNYIRTYKKFTTLHVLDEAKKAYFKDTDGSDIDNRLVVFNEKNKTITCKSDLSAYYKIEIDIQASFNFTLGKLDVRSGVYSKKLTFTVSPSINEAEITCTSQTQDIVQFEKSHNQTVILDVIYGPSKVHITQDDNVLLENDVIVVEHESTYTLKCITDSVNKEAVMSWITDVEHETTPGNIEDSREKIFESRISFTPSKNDDDQTITCSVHNKNSTALNASASLRLSVARGPKALTVTSTMEGTWDEIQSLYITSRPEFFLLNVIDCETDLVYPPKDVEIEFGNLEAGMNMKQPSRSTPERVSRSLEFTPVESMNSITLYCIAKNLRSNATARKDIKLSVPFGPQDATLTSSSGLWKFEIGSKVNLTCKCTSTNPTPSITLIARGVAFEYVGEEKQAGFNNGIVLSKTFTFVASRPYNLKLVKCLVTNPHTNWDSSARKTIWVYEGPNQLQMNGAGGTYSQKTATFATYERSSSALTCTTDVTFPSAYFTESAEFAMRKRPKEHTGDTYKKTYTFTAQRSMNKKNFSCTATNQWQPTNKKTKDVTVVVYFGPTTMEILTNGVHGRLEENAGQKQYFVKLGNKYTVTCNTDNVNEHAEILWTTTITGTQAPARKSTKMTEHHSWTFSSFFIFVAAKEHNQQSLKCEGQNTKHSAFRASNSLEVYVTFGPDELSFASENGFFNRTTGVYNVREETTTNLQCSTDKVSSGVRMSILAKFANKSMESRNSDIYDEKEHTLDFHFTAKRSFNKDILKCKATNFVDSDFSVSKNITLVVLYGPKKVKIGGRNGEVSTRYVSSHSVETFLLCTTDSVNPSGQIRWRTTIPSTAAMVSCNDTQSCFASSITFTPSEKYHSQKIACVAENSLDETISESKEIVLAVSNGPKRLTLRLLGQEEPLNSMLFTYAGQDHEISCETDHVFPDASVSFDKLQGMTENRQQTVGSKRRRVILFNVQASYNKQTLTCRASNNLTPQDVISKDIIFDVIYGPTSVSYSSTTGQLSQDRRKIFLLSESPHNVTCGTDSVRHQATVKFTAEFGVATKTWSRSVGGESAIYKADFSFQAERRLNGFVLKCSAENNGTSTLETSKNLEFVVIFGPTTLTISDKYGDVISNSYALLVHGNVTVLSCVTDTSNPGVNLNFTTDFRCTPPRCSKATGQTDGNHKGKLYRSYLTYTPLEADHGKTVTCEGRNIMTAAINSTKSIILAVMNGPLTVYLETKSFAVYQNSTTNTVNVIEAKSYTFNCTTGHTFPGAVINFTQHSELTVGQTRKVGKAFFRNFTFIAHRRLNDETFVCTATNNLSRNNPVSIEMTFDVSFGPITASIVDVIPLDGGYLRKEQRGVYTVRSGFNYTVKCVTDNVFPDADFIWTPNIFLVGPSSVESADLHRGHKYSTVGTFMATPYINKKVIKCTATNRDSSDKKASASAILHVVFDLTQKLKVIPKGGQIVNRKYVVRDGFHYGIVCLTNSVYPEAIVEWMVTVGNQTDNQRTKGNYSGYIYSRNLTFIASKEQNGEDFLCSALMKLIPELKKTVTLTLNVTYGPQTISFSHDGAPSTYVRHKLMVQDGRQYTVSCTTGPLNAWATVDWTIPEHLQHKQSDIFSTMHLNNSVSLSRSSTFTARLIENRAIGHLEHEFHLVCKATNIHHSGYRIAKALVIDVAYGPKQLFCTVTNGVLNRTSTGLTVTIFKGESFRIRCITDLAYPSVSISVSPEVGRLGNLSSVTGATGRAYFRDVVGVSNIHYHRQDIEFLAMNNFASELKTSEIIRLNVIYGPTVVEVKVKGMNNFYLKVGQSYTFQCESNQAYPNVEFQWMLERNLTQNDERSESVALTTGFLSELSFVLQHVDRKLTCTVTNTKENRITVSRTVTIDNPVDGGWESWQSWSQCSTTCGDGRIFRLRPCINPAPLFGGRFCIGSNHETKLCGNSECTNVPLIAGFSVVLLLLLILILVLAFRMRWNEDSEALEANNGKEIYYLDDKSPKRLRAYSARISSESLVRPFDEEQVLADSLEQLLERKGNISEYFKAIKYEREKEGPKTGIEHETDQWTPTRIITGLKIFGNTAARKGRKLLSSLMKTEKKSCEEVNDQARVQQTERELKTWEEVAIGHTEAALAGVIEDDEIEELAVLSDKSLEGEESGKNAQKSEPEMRFDEGRPKVTHQKKGRRRKKIKSQSEIPLKSIDNVLPHSASQLTSPRPRHLSRKSETLQETVGTARKLSKKSDVNASRTEKQSGKLKQRSVEDIDAAKEDEQSSNVIKQSKTKVLQSVVAHMQEHRQLLETTDGSVPKEATTTVTKKANAWLFPKTRGANENKKDGAKLKD